MPSSWDWGVPSVGRLIHNSIGAQNSHGVIRLREGHVRTYQFDASARVELKCNSSFRLFRCSQHRTRIGEELLRYEAMTGLTDEQLADLVELVHDRCADK